MLNEIDQQLLNFCKNHKEIALNQVEELLIADANPNLTAHCDLFPSVPLRRDFQFPLLHIIAGKSNSVEVAKLLVKYGAQLDAKDTCIGNTPLLTAIALKDEALAQFYIQLMSQNEALKPMLSQSDSGRQCKNTPLVLALKKGLDNVAHAIIVAGADVNIVCRNEETALHWACMLRKNAIISELLLHGAEINHANKFGYYPYEYYHYQLKYIDLANPYEAGERRTLRANMEEFGDLYYQLQDNVAEIFQYLSVFINHRNSITIDEQLANQLSTPNHCSISLEQRHDAMVSSQYFLVLHDVSKQASAVGGFFFASQRHLSNFLNELLKELQKYRFANASLSLAVKERNSEEIENLLREPRDVINQQCTHGFTALHWACMRRDNEMIRRLVQCGADPLIKTKYGKTAIDYYIYTPDEFEFHPMAVIEGTITRRFQPSIPTRMREFHELYSTQSSIAARNSIPMKAIFEARREENRRERRI